MRNLTRSFQRHYRKVSATRSIARRILPLANSRLAWAEGLIFDLY